MNFFEHQGRARNQSRWLFLAFLAAALATVFAVDVVLLLLFGVTPSGANYLATLLPDQGLSVAPTIQELLPANKPLLLGGGATVALVIFAASAYRISTLKGGGGTVAQELGGILVGADTQDPSLRRLTNVIEEMALASGVPVPDVYVLEKEPGINAFAAGYSPSDAAIAVTRGTLESLTRSELQGVIAHEFSHIFNGDMRINVRMMGVLYGILVISVIGRRIMSAAGRGRSRGRSGRQGSAVLLFGLGIMLTGFAGLFFARWIKSAISRQREYLADASAVQFTRDTSGIGGALKKIAVSTHSVPGHTDMEEISHMLFGQVRSAFLFATHPPIVSRIRRLEPAFKEEELDDLAIRVQAENARASETTLREEGETGTGPHHGGMLNPGEILDNIGRPGPATLLAASLLAADFPEDLAVFARTVDWAPAVLLYTLLDPDVGIRGRQVQMVADHGYPNEEIKLRNLLSRNKILRPEQRLPLFELVFPTLKRRPPSELQRLIGLVNALVQADERVDTFEYMLARAISVHVDDALNPRAARNAGRLKLKDCETEIRIVLSVLVRHGHDSDAVIQSAYDRGVKTMDFSKGPVALQPAGWPVILDRCLQRVDGLSASAKGRFVLALVNVAMNDQQVVPNELEMVRAICASVHVPLPLSV